MKTCSLCKTEKPLGDFARKNQKFTSRCKTCNNEYFKKWYKSNQKTQITRVKENAKSRRDIAKQYVKNYLETHPCVMCGNSDILVLEFDHLRDKTQTISSMIQESKSLDVIKAEINKCQVLCANCHKVKTHKEQNTYRVSP